MTAKALVIQVILLYLVFADGGFARPDFDVQPRDIERRIDNEFPSRDTLIIDNSRDHGADTVLVWSLVLDPEEPEWLRVYLFGGEETTALEGAVNPGGSQRVVVIQRGAELEEGQYLVNINFTSNDPTRRELTVPVLGHTTPYPGIAVHWQDLNQWWGVDMNELFQEILYGRDYTISLRIRNPGSALLEVEEITSNNGYWTVVPDSFSIDPGGQRRIDFVFSADEIGPHSTTIGSISNAWDVRELDFRIAAAVDSVFELIAAFPDTAVDEDSGDLLVADLDTVFRSSNRNLIFDVNSPGLRSRIERNHEFFLAPILNWNGESEVSVTASNGITALGDTFRVVVFPVPDPPSRFDLLTPNDGDTLRWDGSDSLFLWQPAFDVDGDTVLYIMQISAGDSSYMSEPVSVPSKSISVLNEVLDVTEGGEFSWTVSATDGDLKTDAWSTFTNYVVSTSIQQGDDSADMRMDLVTIFPNPFNNMTEIRVNLTVKSYLQLEIWDASGRLVEVLDEKFAGPGLQKYHWQPCGVASGNYILRVRTDKLNAAYPVVFSK